LNQFITIKKSMKHLILLLFLFCFSSFVNAQISSASSFISIDHIPIVVKNIDAVKKILSENLGFKIKEGKEHLGIKNCFVKFQDGTYLEFITVVDSLQAMGNYYANFLKNSLGGSSLAISVKSTDKVIKFLNEKNIPFEIDSNGIWKTLEPKGYELFFIEYNNKNWKDSKNYTTHFNKALSLKATYMIDADLKQYEKKYKKFGFSEGTEGAFLGVPYKTLLIGQSKLCMLNASKAKRIISTFNVKKLFGICGFEIKVSSLKELERVIPKSKNVLFKKGKIIYFSTEDNFFLEFTEL
jgi:hypothetical protein